MVPALGPAEHDAKGPANPHVGCASDTVVAARPHQRLRFRVGPRAPTVSAQRAFPAESEEGFSLILFVPCLQFLLR